MVRLLKKYGGSIALLPLPLSRDFLKFPKIFFNFPILGLYSNFIFSK